jgi:hypothetical protein
MQFHRIVPRSEMDMQHENRRKSESMSAPGGGGRNI